MKTEDFNLYVKDRAEFITEKYEEDRKKCVALCSANSQKNDQRG